MRLMLCNTVLVEAASAQIARRGRSLESSSVVIQDPCLLHHVEHIRRAGPCCRCGLVWALRAAHHSMCGGEVGAGREQMPFVSEAAAVECGGKV